MVANAISTLVAFCYMVIFLAAKGATPGKMALGLRVVKADGSPMSAGTAILRVIVEWVLSCVTIGITFLAVAFTQKKQGFHDMAAGTVVIRTR